MFKGIIENYNKKKLEFIRSLAGNQEDEFSEALFVDDGEIENRFNQLTKEHRQVEQEISLVGKFDPNDAERSQKLRFLMKKYNDLREMMAFWASNNLQNLDMCVSLIQKANPPFLQCIFALQAYADGRKAETYNTIRTYLGDGGDFARHFLLNKIYGLLLLEQGETEQAGNYLYRAQRLRSDDLEVNRALCDVYKARNFGTGARICGDILKMMG